MDNPNIGFIGLGDMGEPMARRIMQAGYTVFSSANRSRAAIESLAKEGLIEERLLDSAGEIRDGILVAVPIEGE